jgi:hypothetical protein
LGEFSPHSGRLAIAGAPAHHEQVLPERFEVAGPAEATTCPVIGGQPGESLKEIVVVIADMLEDNCAGLLGAW